MGSVLSHLSQVLWVESLVVVGVACLEYMTVVPRAVFWINPPIVTYSPKLVEFIRLNPYTYVW